MTAQKKTPTTEKPLVKVFKHDFYFDTPLYEPIQKTSIDHFNNLFTGTVDAYSPNNNYDTTYEITKHEMADGFIPGYEGFIKVKLIDRRKGTDDTLRFFIGVGRDFVVKVGQYPSLADLQFAEIGKKYNKFLARSDMQEFKKAIGLAAHGVGAGSFVYLRRIFENLIDESYNQNKANIDTDDADFFKLRMDEKVTALSSYLPSQLVDMKKIYSILSQGVHNLSEEDCLAYFPALQLSIELILEQKIETAAKAERDQKAKAQIAEIQSKLG